MPTAAKIQWPQGQPLFEVQWRAVAESLAGNGVRSASDLEVTATANNREIQVAAGTVYYLASEYSIGAAETHTLTSGDATYDRWDTVVFNTNASDGTTGPTTAVREGTPAADPEPPDVQGDELLLAIVYVPAGASDIPDSDVLNWRAQFANEAEEIHYDDGTGYWGLDSVADVLDQAPDSFVDAAGDSWTGAMDVSGVTGAPVTPGTNPGAYSSIVDAPVDGNDAAGTEESYTFSLDGTDLVKFYTESDGAGGIQNTQVRFLVDTDRPAGDIVTADIGTGAVTLSELASPFGLPDVTDMDAAGTDLADSTAGVTVYDSTAVHVPRPQVDDHLAVTTQTASGTNGSYLTSDEEQVFVDTATNGVAYTVTLASADVASGNVIRVADFGGGAASNNITIDTEGTETIDGASSITLDDNYGSAIIESDGTDWYVVGGTAAGTPATAIVDGAETGNVPASDQGILVVDSLEPGETVRIQKVVFTTATVEAIPSGIDLELVTFDNAGGFTSQAVLASGDGATIYDSKTGSPIASYNNGGTSAQSIGVLVDNTTTTGQEVVADCRGDIV